MFVLGWPWINPGSGGSGPGKGLVLPSGSNYLVLTAVAASESDLED